MSRSFKLKLSKLVNKIKDFELLENAVAQQKAMHKSFGSLVQKQKEAGSCVVTWAESEDQDIQSIILQTNDLLEHWYHTQSDFNTGYAQFAETWAGILAQEKELVPLQKSLHSAEDDVKKKEKNMEAAKKKPDWDSKRGNFERDLEESQESVRRAHDILERKTHEVEIYKVEGAHRAYADLAKTHMLLLREGREIFSKMAQLAGGTPPPAAKYESVATTVAAAAAAAATSAAPQTQGRRASASSSGDERPSEPPSDVSTSSAATPAPTTFTARPPAPTLEPAPVAAPASAPAAPAPGEHQGRVKALYDFPGNEEEGDLCFKAGDVITTTGGKDENGWWFGKLNGKEGNVPSNYVEEMP